MPQAAIGTASTRGVSNSPEAARQERKLTPEQMIEELRPKLDAIPGIRVYLQNPPLIRIGGQNRRAAVSVHAASRRI